jgi:hypothetical protein
MYGHLVHLLVIVYIFPVFGMLYQEQSGSLVATLNMYIHSFLNESYGRLICAC